MGDRDTASERQRHHRLSKRTCGRCGKQPVEMVEWSGRSIPICESCLDKLNAPTPWPVWCGFYEAHPSRFSGPPPSRPLVAEPDLRGGTPGMEVDSERPLLDSVIDCLHWLLGR